MEQGLFELWGPELNAVVTDVQNNTDTFERLCNEKGLLINQDCFYSKDC